MTEADARAWVEARFDEAGAERLARFAELVTAENAQQNLIAPGTVPQIWSRHIVDSAQLVALAPADGLWLDVGTGGGFPGLVVACLRDAPTVLVEPRRRRAEFLDGSARALGLSRVEVRTCKVEALAVPAAVISARAVASVEKLLQGAGSCATTATRWLLPRGRFDPCELTGIRQRWAGVFHVEQSLTDAGSSLLIADGVRRR